MKTWRSLLPAAVFVVCFVIGFLLFDAVKELLK